MDDRQNDTPRARASLRGKGREILLGQHTDAGKPQPENEAIPGTGNPPLPAGEVDPSALALTPDEMNALLNFADDSPVYRPGFSFARSESVSAWGADQGLSASTASSNNDKPVDSGWDVADYVYDRAEPDESAAPVPVQMAEPAIMSDREPDHAMAAEITDIEESSEPNPDGVPAKEWADPLQEGLPIAERQADQDAGFVRVPYEPSPEVQALTPRQPEEWSDGMMESPDREQIEPVFKRLERDEPDSSEQEPVDFHPAAPDDEGGVLLPSAEEDETLPTTISDPFPAPPRTGSEELFKTTPPPDKGMLDQLVDDKRIQKLWKQIETLHEELVAEVEGDRTATDEYQRELLRASGLLLESRQNYDDARAIVYRIRADLNRRRKVTEDIRRYRPMLMSYYVGWGIVLTVLFLLKRPVTDLSESIGSTVITALYYPLLLGSAGALISGYLTLDRHTTKQRDFDPIHITWYLFNPLLGGVMGLLMFLLASIANEDLLQEAASRGEMAITYLLCVIAGMNQSNVLRRLNELMDRFGTSSKK